MILAYSWTTPVTYRQQYFCGLWQDKPRYIAQRLANLGYAEGRWLKSVYPGDTLQSRSEVIGLKGIPTANLSMSMFVRQGLTNTVNRSWNMAQVLVKKEMPQPRRRKRFASTKPVCTRSDFICGRN